jgi:hypothetical protein
MMTEEDDRFFSLEKRRQDPKATASFFFISHKKKAGQTYWVGSLHSWQKGCFVLLRTGLFFSHERTLL